MPMDTFIRGIPIKLDTSTSALQDDATWTHEPENLDFIDALIPGQDIFLDLGACEGRFALYAAKKG